MDEFYDDVQLSPEPASPKTESSSIYQNFKIVSLFKKIAKSSFFCFVRLIKLTSPVKALNLQQWLNHKRWSSVDVIRDVVPLF